jgi:hypothetical protein
MKSLRLVLIFFLAFSAEEWGLYGSHYYSAGARASSERIIGVVNLDMIAYADTMPEDLDIVVKGQKWGPFLALLGGYRLNPRWSVFGNVRYDPMPTGKSSLLVREVRLGGLKIGASVMFTL